MSSPEFAELRGISGNAVAAKAAVLFSARQRSLLYFLQEMSLQPGGLREFIRRLLAKFPHRVGYRDPDALEVLEEIDLQSKPSSPAKKLKAESCMAMAEVEDNLERFIIELCINPKLEFTAPGEQAFRRSARNEFIRQHPGEIHEYDFREAKQSYFHDIIGALFEMQDAHAKIARASIAETEVTRKIAGAMHEALKHPDRIYTIEGKEGIGKSRAAMAWCQQHAGIARYVSLSGATNRTSIFRELAKTLGLGSSYNRKANEMQWRVEDMLHRTKLMLVIDEAAYLLPQSQRCYSRPEMLDWVYTSLANFNVPTVLLVTPVFAKRVSMAEQQTVWNARQFRRRCKYQVLPELSRADLEAVAAKLMPECGRKEIEHAVDYGIVTAWPLTSVVALVEDARDLAAADGKQEINFKYLDRALRDCRVPSDDAQARAFEPAPRRRSGAAPRSLQNGFSAPAPALQEKDFEAEGTARRGNLTRVESAELLDA